MRGSSACRVIQAASGVSSTWPLWNGTGASVQVDLAPGAVEVVRQILRTSSGPRWASSSRPGWRLGRTSTRTPPSWVWTRLKGSRGQGSRGGRGCPAGGDSSALARAPAAR